MNRTRFLIIAVLALGLGFLVSASVYKSLKAGSGPSEPGTEVIVAADDLQVGAKIEEHDIKIIRIPVSDLPPGSPRRKSEVLGHGVIIPISKGEFILPTKLAAENAGAGLPSLIPPGMRAVSVRVNDVVSVAGFVTPGSRVDVLLTGTPGGSSDSQTTTVLQNVQVLAADRRLERNANGEAQTTNVATLLVTPDDAQRLTLASSEGHIQLALRNPLDTHSVDVSPSRVGPLFGAAAPAAHVEHVAVHHASAPKPVAPAPVPSGMSIEVYQGDKKADVVKCTDNGCEAK
jgi:pilus assembly protein CpaB